MFDSSDIFNLLDLQVQTDDAAKSPRSVAATHPYPLPTTLKKSDAAASARSARNARRRREETKTVTATSLAPNLRAGTMTPSLKKTDTDGAGTEAGVNGARAGAGAGPSVRSLVAESRAPRVQTSVHQLQTTRISGSRSHQPRVSSP